MCTNNMLKSYMCGSVCYIPKIHAGKADLSLSNDTWFLSEITSENILEMRAEIKNTLENLNN